MIKPHLAGSPAGKENSMSDFKAKWITNEDFAPLVPLNVFHKELETYEPYHEERYRNRHILFRKKITLPAFEKATVRISADDYYKLYVNGVFVTQGPAPGYPFHYYYNELDLTNYLVPGENTIAVHTYYQGLINRVWVSADYRHGMVFDLTADRVCVAESDESWKCAYHTGFSACGIIGYDTAYAENFDAGSSEYDFASPDFDDNAWQNARYRQNVDYTLYPQPTKQLEIYDVKPKALTRMDKGFRVDFGFEAAGYLTFRASGKRGDVITLRFGEELNDDGSVRFDMRCNCKYEEYFTLSGRPDDRLSQYDYKAFRYAEILLPDGAVINEDSIAITVRHYPFREIKHYTGKNERLAAIYKLCSNTVKYGVQECFVDCPTREKGQYLGDVTIAGIASVALTGDPAMMKKALENYAQSSFICKGLMTVAPASFMQEIADYSLQFPFQVLWLYRYTGDKAFLEHMYPFVKNVYEYFAAFENEYGLIENIREKWNLVDWPDNLRDNYDFPLERPIGPGCHNLPNAFYLAMLKSVEEICAALGKPPLGDRERVREAYIRAFYNKEQKLFVDSVGSAHASFHSNVIALFAGVWTDEENKRAIIGLIERKKLTCGGVYMAFFAGYALKQVGETELMERLIADDDAWANMLAEGATTCFEAWGKEQKWNTSLFHPWASAPAILL